MTNNGMSFEMLWNGLTDKNTYKNMGKTPCVLSSYLWGFGCGGLMIAHKARLYPGKTAKIVNAGFLTLLAVASYSFVKCVDEQNAKHERLKKEKEQIALMLQHQQQFQQHLSSSSSSGSSSSDSSGQKKL